jgi:hypothetical protein
LLSWLLIGCATRLVSVPIEVTHIGPAIDPPRFALVPVWVEAAEDRCAHLAEGLRAALTLHAGMMLWSRAETRLRITRCETNLDERITVSAPRTVALEQGEALDVILTGRANLSLEIWREQQQLDTLTFDAVHIDSQQWIGGNTYPWRETLAGLAERDLVESIETALISPHAALRPLHRDDDPVFEPIPRRQRR